MLPTRSFRSLPLAMSLSRVSLGAVLLSLLAGVTAQGITSSQSLANFTQAGPPPNNTKVLILGGGMAGIIAARTLHEQGIDDFVVVDAKTEFGGRMIQKPFGLANRQVVIENGPSWIKGTQDGDGNANPVWELALKHNLSMVESDLYGSVSFFDYTGPSNYSEAFYASIDAFNNVTVTAGRGLAENKVDLDLSSAYGYLGVAPTTPQEQACQYYQVDFEYAQSPAQTSWFASAWRNNFTYVPEAGGYSDVNMMSVDPRGIAFMVQAEAVDFMKTNQILYNETVSSIHYDENGVTVLTAGGYNLTADHALVTFSVGVLQNTDVVFQPAFPDWKREAVNSIEMAGYNKIFLQFNETFWFDTEMGLYADLQRGKFPVWQSLDHPDFFPGSGIISVTVTGDYSPYVEQLNTTQLQNEVMAILRTMYPNAPEPADIHIASWGSNTLYRGAYSNWGASFVPGHLQNLRANLDGHLWFAGEATSLKYYGLLQGAYLEGQRVGLEIADCINKGQCSVPPDTSIVNAEPYPSSLLAQ